MSDEVFIGATFNRLKVISFSHREKSFDYFNCICNCGNTKTVRAYYLKNGHTKSCGCLISEKARQCNYKIHGKSKTKLYRVWKTMHSRCENPKNENYPNYGKKGIVVCSEWHDLDSFLSWANRSGYQEGLSIDRIDSSGNYEPSNCRWATMYEQQNNKTNNVVIQHNGLKMTITQWSRYIGGCDDLVYGRLKMGWDEIRAVTTPIRKIKK